MPDPGKHYNASPHKALIVAGIITGLLITAVADLSYVSHQKSLPQFTQPTLPCALSICSLL